MIKYIYADALDAFPKLADSMFKDRAEQFKMRHKWDVTVDENGHERDQYDVLNPLYVIYELPDGTHGGSIRIMPTTGRTMVNEHFTHLMDGVHIASPVVWECTRFCISPRLGADKSKVAASLLVAGCELGIRFGLISSVGVIYKHTLAIYKRIGWMPDVIGTQGEGSEQISACLWPINEESKASICAKVGLDPDVVSGWFDASFPVQTEADLRVA